MYGVNRFVREETFVLIPNGVPSTRIVTWYVRRDKGGASVLMTHSLPQR